MSTTIDIDDTFARQETTGAGEPPPPKILTDAKKNDPRLRLLMHPELVRLVSCVLRRQGVPARDIEDGVQDVRLRVLEWFVDHELPFELGQMKSLCATIARRWVIDRLRRSRVRKELGAAGLTGRADRHELPRPTRTLRDPVDGRRERGLAAELFRRGRMPEHGIDILEGAAWEVKQEELAHELGITPRAVEGRLRTVRRVFARELRGRRMG